VPICGVMSVQYGITPRNVFVSIFASDVMSICPARTELGRVMGDCNMGKEGFVDVLIVDGSLESNFSWTFWIDENMSLRKY
jgi:hypothetical protein